jgi:hypothetical protein
MYTYKHAYTHNINTYIYISGIPAEKNAVDILQILYEDYNVLKILLVNCLGLVPVSNMEVCIYIYIYMYIYIYIYIYMSLSICMYLYM